GLATPVQPTVTSPFINGTWSGPVTMGGPGTNVVLRADDGNAHSGSRHPFLVELRNDIALQMTDSPDPVSTGGNVTYQLTVTNVGPASATGVVVTNWLPATAALVSVTTSQGPFTTNGGMVVCIQGNKPDYLAASISIVSRSTVAVLNFVPATVYRN